MIRRARFACALTLFTAGLFAFAAPPAAADAVVDVTATFADGRPAFVSEGAVNPSFTFTPGEEVTITVKFDGFHNFRVADPINEETSRRSSGTESLSFTIPGDFTGDVAYVCDVHPSTMRGTLSVTGNASAEADAADAPDAAVENATVVDFTAMRDDEGFAFTTPDGTRNPTLRFDPGEDVLVRLTVNGTHNLHVDAPVDARTDVQSGGNTTLRFTIPADFTGTIAYWCDPHRGAGMTGVIQVGGADADAGAEDEGDAGAGADEDSDAGMEGHEEAGTPPPDAHARTPAPGLVAGVVALAFTAGACRAWRVTRP